jgi:hypothetical protein
MDFLFDECGQLANQDFLSIGGTPDKVGSQLVGDGLGMVCIQTRQDNRGSNA